MSKAEQRQAILAARRYASPSVFKPENLLREARRVVAKYPSLMWPRTKGAVALGSGMLVPAPDT
ncbi:MAG: hypothetical protein EXR07_04880 [Acetobacteraceae bacterium]|nr:hypothetical protein [Acetobacteraceae bacterium]